MTKKEKYKITDVSLKAVVCGEGAIWPLEKQGGVTILGSLIVFTAQAKTTITEYRI